MEFQINNTATPFLNKLLELVTSDKLARLLELPLQQYTKEYILNCDTTKPNKNNWPRTHFYREAAESLNSKVEGSRITQSVNKLGFAQRFYGGPINPVNKKYLTIPACQEAYGHTAREFDFLVLQWGMRNGSPQPVGLKQATLQLLPGKKIKGIERPKRTRKAFGGKMYYWFSQHVDQLGDKSIIPTEKDYLNVIEKNSERIIKEMESK